MMEFLRLSWPIAAVLAFVFNWKVGARWWQMRRNRKADDKQRDALDPFATSLGGSVVGPEGAAAWSAELQGPLANDVDDFTEKLLQRSGPGFDLALDFQRGPWHVRVSQASMRQQTGNRVGRLHEHRIEVATSLLAPMRITRHAQISFGGRMLARREAPAPPRTAELSQAEWLPLRLPLSVDDRTTPRTGYADRGAGDLDPARHLRLGLRRTELLGAPAIRLPAWTLFDHAGRG